MTWVDAIPFLFIVGYGVLGYFTGLIRRIISLIALYISFVAATNMGLQAGGILQQNPTTPTPDARLYGFFRIALGAMIVLDGAGQPAPRPIPHQTNEVDPLFRAAVRAPLGRGDSLAVKLGLDPTATDLHVGHLVVLDALRAFQDDGHTVVIIIGDYTALIGDPSGRSETRPVLTPEQVATNAETYFEQIDLVLERDRIEVRYNSEWLAAMTAADILRLLSKATLQQVLQREDFSDRGKAGTPIGAHEILYPFNQAYDSVAIKPDVEIGGTDQRFHLLFGPEIPTSSGQEPQDIAVFPLLEGTDGSAKMSKSLGNYIGLAEPPEEIYRKTMSIPDRLTEKYLHLVSGLPSAEVEKVLAMKPRDAKAC